MPKSKKKARKKSKTTTAPAKKDTALRLKKMEEENKRCFLSMSIIQGNLVWVEDYKCIEIESTIGRSNVNAAADLLNKKGIDLANIKEGGHIITSVEEDPDDVNDITLIDYFYCVLPEEQLILDDAAKGRWVNIGDLYDEDVSPTMKWIVPMAMDPGTVKPLLGKLYEDDSIQDALKRLQTPNKDMKENKQERLIKYRKLLDQAEVKCKSEEVVFSIPVSEILGRLDMTEKEFIENMTARSLFCKKSGQDILVASTEEGLNKPLVVDDLDG